MRSSPFVSLRFRLVVLILLAIVPSLGLTLYTHSELRHLTTADAERETLRLARIVANDQEDNIKDTQQLLFALAELPDVHRLDRAACSEFLTDLCSQYHQYAFLGIVTSNGDPVCSASPAGEQIDLVHSGANRASV